MTLFEFLLVGHLIGDYILQTRWMAENKKDKWLPLILHCAIYTAVATLIALPAGGLSLNAIALIFLSHALLDNRIFIDFWVEKITRSRDTAWLKTMVDQSWHIIVLALATLLSR